MNIIKSFVFSVLGAALIAGGVFIVQKAQFQKELEIVIGQQAEIVSQKEEELAQVTKKAQEDAQRIEQEALQKAKKIEEEALEKAREEKEALEAEHQKKLAELEKEKQQANSKTQEAETQQIKVSLKGEFTEARLLLAQNKYHDAIESFKKFDSSAQELFGEAQFSIAAIYAYLGDDENAIKHAKSAAQIGGVAGHKAEVLSASYARFKQANDGKPEYKDALIASALLETGELQLARQKANKIIISYPEYKDAHIIMGIALFAEKNYADAIKALASQAPLQNARANYYLGLSYFNTQQFTKAADHLELALKQNFQDDPQKLKETLADAHNYSENYNRAATVYEDVIASYDKDISYYVQPIVIYIEKINRPEKAVALGAKAIEKHAGEAMAYNLAGWANLSAGNLDETQKLLDKAIDLDDTNAAPYLNYGHLYVKRREYQVAKQYYERAIERAPDNSIGIRAREEINKILTGVYK